MTLHLNQKQSLAEQAYERIEELIVTLKLAPGTVFSEAALSTQLDIGRTPIREALQKLSQQRLVATLPRRGMIVSEINIGDHLALLETRRVLDRLIVTRAARRALPEQRTQLRACARSIQQAAAKEDLANFMRLDHDADRVLEAACHNPFAVQACAPLHVHCRRFWYIYRANGDLQHSAALHAAVLHAVAGGSEMGAAAAADTLIDYLEKFARSAVNL